jgi:hypothetical protein
MHTCLVVSPTALYLTLHTPAGFDGFVRDVSGADGMPPYRAALIALPAEHGIDIVGPHCSPLASESPRARYYGGGDCALGGRGRQYRRSGDGDGGGAQGTLPG